MLRTGLFTRDAPASLYRQKGQYNEKRNTWHRLVDRLRRRRGGQNRLPAQTRRRMEAARIIINAAWSSRRRRSSCSCAARAASFRSDLTRDATDFCGKLSYQKPLVEHFGSNITTTTARTASGSTESCSPDFRTAAPKLWRLDSCRSSPHCSIRARTTCRR